MTKAATDPSKARRLQLIKLIHVAKRELERSGQMDDSSYRAMLQAVGKAGSTKDMSIITLHRVVEHLKRCGFKVRSKSASRLERVDRVQAQYPEAKKIRALWLFLYQLGAVRDSSESALSAYVKRIGKVDDLQWLKDVGSAVVIETLKKWAMRFLPAAILVLRDQVKDRHRLSPLRVEQINAINSAASRLKGGDGFDIHWFAWETLSEVLNGPIGADLQPLSIKERTK